MHKHTKCCILKGKGRNKKTYFPIIDEVDIYYEKGGRTVISMVENHLKKKGIEPFKIYKTIVHSFFDKVLKDIILNNAVFILPENVGYMVAGQFSTDVSEYNPATGQCDVRVFMLFAKNMMKEKLTVKHITLAPKYQKMLEEEIKNQRIYPPIEKIIKTMTDYGY